jgi:hypothetical protein
VERLGALVVDLSATSLSQARASASVASNSLPYCSTSATASAPKCSSISGSITRPWAMMWTSFWS